MNLIETTINIGINKPVQILHVSDTHLTFADMRDGQRKVSLSEKRKNNFPNAEKVLDFAKKVAKERELKIIHTGDLIDFVSLSNLEKAKEFINETDCFVCAGNHEFAQYVGEAIEDENYRNQSLPIVQKYFSNNIRMDSRVVDGVNFVALDNSYYLFDSEQFEFLKKEIKKNIPIVLLLHNPIYEPNLYNVMMEKSSSAYLVGVPESLMKTYSPKRFNEQKADQTTFNVIDYIKEQNLIKCIVSGHLHFNYQGMLTSRIPQITTSCEDVRLLKFN